MLIVRQMTPVSALCGGKRRLLLQMPLPAAICPLTQAAEGNSGRGEQREEKREEDDFILCPNPALTDKNPTAM